MRKHVECFGYIVANKVILEYEHWNKIMIIQKLWQEEC